MEGGFGQLPLLHGVPCGSGRQGAPGSFQRGGSSSSRRPVTGGASACSGSTGWRSHPDSVTSLLSVGSRSSGGSCPGGRSALLERLLHKPVLAEQDPKRYLTQPGAPPRRVGSAVAAAARAEVADHFPGSEVSIEEASRPAPRRPKLTPPRMRRPRDSERRESEGSDDGHGFGIGILPGGRSVLSSPSSRSQPLARQGSFSSLSSTSGHRSSRGRDRCPPRPPSRQTISEVLYERSILGKGNMMCRSELAEAIEVSDAEAATFAEYQRECKLVEQGYCRKQAARWREQHQRDQQIEELRWNFRDPSLSSHFEVDKEKVGAPRVVTPVLMLSSKASRVSAASTSPRRESLQDSLSMPVNLLRHSTLRPKQPYEDRMHILQTNAKVWWKNVKAEWAEEKKRGAEDGPPMEKFDGILSQASYREDTALTGDAGFRGLKERLERKSRLARRLSSSGVGSLAAEARRWGRSSVGRFQQLTWEEVDRAALKQAFGKHDVDDNERLDHSELLMCIANLGLRPHTKVERQQVRQIIWNCDRLLFSFQDFAEEIVLRIRDKLTELREPGLERLFNKADTQGKGELSVQEIGSILRRTGNFVSETVLEEAILAYVMIEHDGGKLKDVQSGHGGYKKVMLEMDGFVQYVRLIQEYHVREDSERFQRIITQFGMSKDDQEAWRHDLVGFHKMCYEYDPCSGKFGSSEGVLNEFQMITVLRESGYMPKTKQKQQSVWRTLPTIMRPDGTFTFMEFLQIMNRLRECDRERLRRIIDNKLTHSSNVIRMGDLGDLLTECGVLSCTADERAEIKLLMEDSDHEDSGVLTRDEVVILCQRIKAKVRGMQREREKQYVLSSGWNEQNFADFRSAFQTFDEDMSEILERDELMKAIEVLKGTYFFSPGNMELIFVALGIDHTKDIKVNFLMFLRMLKMLEETEARQQLGANNGFTRGQTDKLYGTFKALDPGADITEGTVKRDTVEKAILQCGSKWLGKPHLVEVARNISQEPQHMEFGAFLRHMKVLEGHAEGAFENFVDDLLAWEDGKIEEEDTSLQEDKSGGKEASKEIKEAGEQFAGMLSLRKTGTIGSL